MDIFIWMYVALLFFALIAKNVSGKSGRILCCVGCFFVLWLIQALRDVTIGTDLQVYLQVFKNAGRHGITEYIENSMEKGYQLFNNVFAQYISDEPNVFLAGVSAIVLIPVSAIIYKKSLNPVLSFIIFASFILYHFTFSGLRQSIALGLVAWSFEYIDARKLKSFLFVVVLATMFHISSIIFLIAYPLCNYIHLTPRKYAVLGMFALVGVFALRAIVASLIGLIFGNEKYSNYIEQSEGGAYMLMILLILIFLMTFLAKGREIEKYRILLFVAVLCQSLGLISQVATRIAYYFIFFVCLAIPEVTQQFKSINRQTVNIGVIAFMIFFFFYTNGDGYLDVIPYHFYWE